jgi:dihydrofolate reductase
MAKIVLTMSVSLDGFLEGPDRDISWHVIDDELLVHFNEWLGQAGMFLDGRVTWELMAEFWPTADADPAATPVTVEFARIWRDMPKVVYSRTLPEAGWNTVIVREVVPAEVRELAARAGGDVVIGGGDLAASFMAHGLIDEFRIYVHPVLIGAGKPLFPLAPGHVGLRLTENRTFGTGVVLLRYER